MNPENSKCNLKKKLFILLKSFNGFALFAKVCKITTNLLFLCSYSLEAFRFSFVCVCVCT